MGLKCLIGHDFGDVLTDRDREERGEEVVVTVREYRECERCGETRVLSENKEVRTTAVSDPSTEDDGEGDASTDEEGADLEDVSAEEDDGVILQEERSTGRERGEWPARDVEADAAAEEPSGDPAPWPEVEGEDEGFAAEPSGGGSAEGVDFGGGLTPEPAAPEPDADPGPAGESEEVLEAASERGSSGIRRATSSPEPTGRQREADSDAEFYCPECEHTAPSDGSSLRPGDICPECRLGYLTERTA